MTERRHRGRRGRSGARTGRGARAAARGLEEGLVRRIREPIHEAALRREAEVMARTRAGERGG